MDPRLKDIKGKEFKKNQNEVGSLNPWSPDVSTDALKEVSKSPLSPLNEEETALNPPKIVGKVNMKKPSESSLALRQPQKLDTSPFEKIGEPKIELDQSPVERKKLEIPEAFKVSENATQGEKLQQAEQTIAAVETYLENPSVSSDMLVSNSEEAAIQQQKKEELSKKLQEAKLKVKEAKEWYDNWTLAVSMLREDVKAAKESNDYNLQIFKSFVETDPMGIPLNDEAYLAALVSIKARITDGQWIVQVGQAQQYFSDAKRDLEGANQLMDSIVTEITGSGL